jgi:hypothetical protein
MINGDSLTTEITPEVLQKYKHKHTTMDDYFGGDHGLTDEDKILEYETFYEMAMDDEDRLIQAVILHTLETVRGADRRGLLDDLTLEELKVTVLSDLGII